MTTRDLLRITYITNSLPPANRVNGTVTGNAVDLLGYDGAVIVVTTGAYTDGTHVPSVLQSMDGVTYTACAVTDLDGTFATIASSASANTVQQVGYIGTQRYLQVVMTTTGATSGATTSAHIVAGYPRNAPTQ
ncbi:MAG: hypothetical protein JO126_04555 [Alphaproteobacteria bacterium]|nr:hypothetical protein [Alphaproteobacteria bacterium]MBV8548708.1 hypothetical protein [Alphaproteobacteria bacterium]